MSEGATSAESGAAALLLLRQGPAVVLASASATRFALLRAAGVPVVVEPASIDEAEVKNSLRAAGAGASAAAEALAELKAQKISRRRLGAIVLGADQILECDGSWFDKPVDPSDARRQLVALRGRSHELIASVVAVRDGIRLWHRTELARLTMRLFSDAFLDEYLGAASADVLRSVGAYQIEGLGAQLFAHIEGDYSTILGLPLLPVLEFLRNQGALNE